MPTDFDLIRESVTRTLSDAGRADLANAVMAAISRGASGPVYIPSERSASRALLADQSRDLLAAGRSLHEVARLHGVHPVTVKRWLKR